MAAIFVADILTGIEIAVSVLYAVVIVLVMPFGSRRVVSGVGLISLLLTLGSFALTRGWADDAGLANTSISVVAIVATTLLASRIIRAGQHARAVEQTLAHMSRLSMLGELSAAIEHEVSQPLAAIVANGTAARRWLGTAQPNVAEADKALQLVVSEADRGGMVLDRVRALARRAPRLVEPVSLRDCLERIRPLIDSELRRHDVVLETHVAADLPRVAGDAVQLQQVLLNLVLNAVAAMNSPKVPRRLLAIAARMEAGEVVVTVADTGTGIPAGQEDTIFEPFHSTRPEGLGLGLAICRSIVEQSGGRIWMQRADAGGSLFCFSLPALAAG